MAGRQIGVRKLKELASLGPSLGLKSNSSLVIGKIASSVTEALGYKYGEEGN